MRILHSEASLGWGGQEIRTLLEAHGMRDRGHEVFIMAPPDSEIFKRASKEGFTTIPFVFKRRYIPWITFSVKRFIENNNIDIVNTHSSKDSWIVLPAAKLAKNRPLIIRTRHLSTRIGNNPLSRMLYNSFPHFVITTGEAIRQQMIEYNRFNPEKIISIPTGVDTDFFSPGRNHTDLREELGLSTDTPLIGTLSVIRSWKGIDYLVMAMPYIVEKIPNARLVIAGDGIHRNTLEKTIKDTGVANLVYMLGFRKDVINVLSSLNVLVHPSYANEGVPQTVLQAMALEKPVVASDLPPLREVVRDGETGLTFPVKDPGAIADAVLRVLNDNELSKRLSEEARRLVVARYSMTSMLDRIEKLYEGRYMVK